MAVELVEPQVPEAWKVVPPSKERAPIFWLPLKLLVTMPATEPFRSRSAVVAMLVVDSSVSVAPLATATLPLLRLPLTWASSVPALTVVPPV